MSDRERLQRNFAQLMEAVEASDAAQADTYDETSIWYVVGQIQSLTKFLQEDLERLGLIEEAASA